MAVRYQYRGGQVETFDNVTHERMAVTAPLFFKEDFLGRIVNVTDVWRVNITGAAPPTAAIMANGGNGVCALTLTSANEAQLAGIDFADQRPLVLNQGLVAEFRFRLSVLPTGLVTACVGLCGAHDAAVNTVAQSIWFRADGNGALTVETDDGTNETSLVATGTTLTATDWAIGRIDCSEPTSVKFFINGSPVATGTTFNMNATPTLALQPVARIGKEAGATTVGTMLVDYVAIWQRRS